MNFTLQWVSLEQAKHGMVHLRLMWLQLSKDPADLKAVRENVFIVFNAFICKLTELLINNFYIGFSRNSGTKSYVDEYCSSHTLY